MSTEAYVTLRASTVQLLQRLPTCRVWQEPAMGPLRQPACGRVATWDENGRTHCEIHRTRHAPTYAQLAYREQLLVLLDELGVGLDLAPVTASGRYVTRGRNLLLAWIHVARSPDMTTLIPCTRTAPCVCLVCQSEDLFAEMRGAGLLP